MNRIQTTFETLRQKGEKALVGFVSAGDPSVEKSLAIIKAMCREGVDILELGVPFSDPTADGPVIQRSSSRALKAGINLGKVLEMTREIRRETEIPIVLFSYYNPILAYGAARFYKDALDAGADGVLVVDLPPEESEEMTSQWAGNDLDLIRLVAPTTPPDRMSAIADGASGFLYLVSMTGVTGSGGLDLAEISAVTETLKSRCNGIPICVGFGISTPEQVRAIGVLADGIVVGSAFERLIENNLEDPNLADKVGAAVKALKEATR
ncbi:tryptophan synthase subunit alpha [Desulforhabdus amnigena]|uniref:Tryptophan synthase alpha chain n=1 Tax=Desulforhabdus amnigena TaxID=40218 RepID=A0A9W6FU29_9BACT|nr:tryptophan synthase subunit alpha [Desulforhabdus amnigena]NLJ28753.1 tryptophan synthase subunit alpha [Deltaproteobacteria bacterium]GLI34899.1 tryptophan synthase alpha chain [Desulforhabdus amnigena]